MTLIFLAMTSTVLTAKSYSTKSIVSKIAVNCSDEKHEFYSKSVPPTTHQVRFDLIDLRKKARTYNGANCHHGRRYSSSLKTSHKLFWKHISESQDFNRCLKRKLSSIEWKEFQNAFSLSNLKAGLASVYKYSNKSPLETCSYYEFVFVNREGLATRFLFDYSDSFTNQF